MWEIIKAAGWPIWPLIIASVVALAIIGERFFALRRDIVAPSNLLPEVQKWLGQGGVTKETLHKLEQRPHMPSWQAMQNLLSGIPTNPKPRRVLPIVAHEFETEGQGGLEKSHMKVKSTTKCSFSNVLS